MDLALSAVTEFMEISVPVIGRATKYMKRSAKKRKRPLTLQQVIDSFSPFPLLVVPRTSEGVINHALCVVDDLVFDSITHKALKLCPETFLWILNDSPIPIHQALHFDHNLTSKANRLTYDRPCIKHFP
jgi:hypothetical protein